MNKSFLELDHLEKRFGATPVTRDVSLSVQQSEILALLGPSGSGKTTILRLVAGFESLDAGRIVVGGEDVTALPPERRRFGMVFQHYALFPHMTVAENVAFGLDGRTLGPREAARKRVAEMLSAVGLAGFEDRPVTRLSGGQQQRVALARALAPEPRVLLLDEPLSNLDPALRERTRRELARILRRTGITTLFVTHEQEEAFDLGDRIAVLNEGRLEQVGTPEALYEEPARRFVATFVGRASVLPGTWEDGPGAVRLDAGPLWRAVAAGPLPAGAPAELVVRPESLAFATAAGPNTVAGSIAARRFAGHEAYFEVALDAGGSLEVVGAPRVRSVGDRVFVGPGGGGPPPRAFPRETA